MKFSFNDEQVALNDAIKDFFSSRSTSDTIRAAIGSKKGYDEELFTSMCSDLGLASLIVSEDQDGFGATDVELAIVMEHHGYYLVPSPLRTHVSAQFLIQECSDPGVKTAHLSRLVSGNELAAGVYDNDFTLTVSLSESTPIVNGRFARVPFGHIIDHLYFPVDIDGMLCLAYLDCTMNNVTRYQVPSIDQTQPLGAIECENVAVEIIGRDISSGWSRAYSRAVISATNEMVGSTQAVLDMSVTYAKDRIQFSRPIGSFQAIKHKCADMLLETESARSIALFGAWLSSQDEGFVSDDVESDLNHIASVAKYYCSLAFSHASGENIQIHGGIGFTMEHDAQLYFKRAAFMKAHLGMPHEHAERIATTLIERIEK